MELHENSWRWRSAYAGEPYWVHFQTTDVTQFAAHLALGQRFTPGAEVALTPDQLQALRTLGYIQ